MSRFRIPGYALLLLTLLPGVLSSCAKEHEGSYIERIEDGIRVLAYTQGIPPEENPYTIGNPITYGAGQSEDTCLLVSAGFSGRFSDGTVLITDFREGRLHRFSPEGEWLSAFGRLGPGPYEFGTHPGPFLVNDEIRVWVSSTQRLLRFDRRGNYLDGLHSDVRTGMAPVPVSAGSEEGYITMYSSMTMPDPDSNVAAIRYGVFHLSADLSESDTLLYREGEAQGFWIGSSFNLQPFEALFPTHAAAPDLPIARGHLQEYRIDFMSAEGTSLFALEIPIEGVRITDEEKEQEIARFRRSGQEETARRHLRFPDRKPAIRWMIWAGDGRLWVEDYSEVPGDENGRHYHIFTAAGEWVAGQVLPGRPTAIMGDGCYRSGENDAGEPVVRFYPFR